MISYLIRRILLMIPTLIGCTAVVFFVIALSPGGLASSVLNSAGELRPAERQAREEYLNRRYGLNRALPVQYFAWLNKGSPVGVKDAGTGFPAALPIGFKWPDLGESFSKHRPVSELIWESLPVSLSLQALSLPLVYVIAIGTGILAAKGRGKFWDTGMGSILIALYSI